jgi:transposase
MRVRPTYSEQFRADSVALLKKGDRSVAQLSSDLGVAEWTLRDWYKRDVARKSGKKRVLTPAEVAAQVQAKETVEERVARLEKENDALRRKNAQLEVDREILKKAAAFFAKENE